MPIADKQELLRRQESVRQVVALQRRYGLKKPNPETDKKPARNRGSKLVGKDNSRIQGDDE